MIRVVQLDENTWGVQSDRYSPALYKIAKTTPGTSWDGDMRAWIGYPDCIATVRRKLRKAGIAVQGKVARPSKDADVLVPAAFDGLRDYQAQGVRFLIQTAGAGAILGDDLGVGKTIQAIRTARSFKRRTLIVCPAGLRHVWEMQLQQKRTKERPEGWPDAPIFHARSTKPEEIPAGTKVVIINYDILYAWEAALLAWMPTTLIIDEAHRLQSDRSRRSKSMRIVAGACKLRIALTATPFNNRPKDLWNLVDTISPGRLGKAFPFYLRHCGAYQEQVTPTKVVWKFDKASNLKELNRRLRYFMIRRLKSEITLQLPAFERQVVPVEVKRGFKLALDVAVRNDGQLRRALDMAADGKFDDVVQLAASHVKEGHQAIVFTHRRVAAEHVAQGLLGQGVKVGVIHGGHSQKERLRRAAAKPDVLVCTMDSMGEGVDLSYADVVVFAELHWIPSTLIQCEGRAHRFGQKRSVLVQYVIARGTADELIQKAIIGKLKNFQAAIGNVDGKLQETLEGDRKQKGAAALRALAARLSRLAA